MPNILRNEGDSLLNRIQNSGENKMQTIKSLINQNGTSMGDVEIAGNPNISVLSRFQRLELQSIFNPSLSDNQFTSPIHYDNL